MTPKNSRSPVISFTTASSYRSSALALSAGRRASMRAATSAASAPGTIFTKKSEHIPSRCIVSWSVESGR